MIRPLHAITMRLGRPLPETLAGNLRIVRSVLVLLFLVFLNPSILSWLKVSGTISPIWGWTLFVFTALLLAREFAENFHCAEVRRASQRGLSPLERLQN